MAEVAMAAPVPVTAQAIPTATSMAAGVAEIPPSESTEPAQEPSETLYIQNLNERIKIDGTRLLLYFSWARVSDYFFQS